MKKHITVVYIDQDGKADAFHVLNADFESLRIAYLAQPIASIKNITIERDSSSERKTQTLFTKTDITRFLKKWKLNDAIRCVMCHKALDLLKDEHAYDDDEELWCMPCAVEESDTGEVY